MDNRDRLLAALAILIEVADETRDNDLDGPLALLCACGAAIAEYAEGELIEVSKPIIERLTAENMPALYMLLRTQGSNRTDAAGQ